jgi:UV excision repair protein RAD23
MNLILSGDPNVGLAAGAGGALPGVGFGGQEGANPPGTLSVTEEEMAAIDRLTSLGFPKHRAAEAYFSCDKNEEFAANFLFETAGEDDEAML